MIDYRIAALGVIALSGCVPAIVPESLGTKQTIIISCDEWEAITEKLCGPNGSILWDEGVLVCSEPWACETYEAEREVPAPGCRHEPRRETK